MSSMLLLSLLAVAAAENVAISGSYGVPEADYHVQEQLPLEAPSTAYGVPVASQAPSDTYGPPTTSYSAAQATYGGGHNFGASSHEAYPTYDNSFVQPGGLFNLGKFKGDWVLTGVLLAGVVVLLSLIGVVTVPFLPTHAFSLPSLGFNLGIVKDARSLSEWSLADVANAVDNVEAAIYRARKFIAEFKPKKA